MLNKIRVRIDAIAKILAARKDFFAYDHSVGGGVTIMESGILFRVLCTLANSRILRLGDNVDWRGLQFQKKMVAWVKTRLKDVEGGVEFEGDYFRLFITGKFKRASEVVAHDFMDLYCRNVYCKYMPFLTLVRSGDVVFDAGANIGAFAVWAATRANDVTVVAVEPDDQIAKALQANIDLNNLGSRIRIEKVCLSDKSGTVNLVSDPDCFTMTRIGEGEGVAVPAVTMDSIAENLGLTRLDLVKMDIEGAERYALRGMRESIRKFKPRLAISGYHLPDDVYVLCRIIREIAPDYDIVVTNELFIYATPREFPHRPV